MTQIDQAAKLLGIEVVLADDETVATRMTVTPEHLNALGVCHGGVIFTLADAAMATLSNAGFADNDSAALAANAEIDFLRPASSGTILTATARTTADAGRTSVHDIVVEDDDGAVIAVFRGRTRAVTRR